MRRELSLSRAAPTSASSTGSGCQYGDVDDQQREKAEHRLRILKAVSVAVERRNEVLEAIAGSVDAEEARGRLAALMNIDEDAAEAVISMQFRRLSRRERTSLATEIQDLADALLS